jgi:hypothetical protein
MMIQALDISSDPEKNLPTYFSFQMIGAQNTEE